MSSRVVENAAAAIPFWPCVQRKRSSHTAASPGSSEPTSNTPEPPTKDVKEKGSFRFYRAERSGASSWGTPQVAGPPSRRIGNSYQPGLIDQLGISSSTGGGCGGSARRRLRARIPCMRSSRRSSDRRGLLRVGSAAHGRLRSHLVGRIRAVFGSAGFIGDADRVLADAQIESDAVLSVSAGGVHLDDGDPVS